MKKEISSLHYRVNYMENFVQNIYKMIYPPPPYYPHGQQKMNSFLSSANDPSINMNNGFHPNFAQLAPQNKLIAPNLR